MVATLKCVNSLIRQYIIVRALKIEREQRLFKLKAVHQTGLSLKTLQKYT